MITDGWIFPDGTEYYCGGESFEIHDTVVIDFIRGLRFYDLELKLKLDKMIEDLFFKYGGRDLYPNFAVERLGWIKVSSLIIQRFDYAGFDWQQDLIKPYEDQGFTPNNWYRSSSLYIPTKCNYRLAIRNGGERYDSNDRHFKYDGTDKEDFYFDEAGVRHIPPWATSQT